MFYFYFVNFVVVVVVVFKPKTDCGTKRKGALPLFRFLNKVSNLLAGCTKSSEKEENTHTANKNQRERALKQNCESLR